MLIARLLPLVIVAQTGCSALFGGSESADLDDAGTLDAGAIDATSDARTIPYSLAAVWQSPTDTVTGQVALGPDQRPAFAGHFTGSITVNGLGYTSAGGLDLLLMRFDPATGAPTVPQQYGWNASEFTSSLSIGDDNDLVVTGGIIGVNADVGGVNYEGASSMIPTAFAARYGEALEHEWSLFFDSNADNSSAKGLSATGPMYICGSYAGNLNVPHVDGTSIQLQGQSELAAFYSKYNGDGSFSGGGPVEFTGLGQERCELVVNDGLGSAFVAGSYTDAIDFSKTLNFDPGDALPDAAASTTSLFIGRIDHDQHLQWVASIPGSLFALPVMHGALGLNNQLVFVSEIEGELMIPDLGTTLQTENDEDIALFIVSPLNGEILSAQSFPSLGTDRAAAVTVAPTGEIAIVGRFTGTINFGGEDLVTRGLDDIFIAVFDPQGQHLWSTSFGTTTSDRALSAVFDANGALYMTVRHQNNIDFGLGPLTGLNSGALIKFE